MNKIDQTTRGIASMISNPTYISYGLLGISSVILGYYTLFDNNIDEVVPEQPPEIDSFVLPSQEQPMQGGKKKNKYTRKHKK